jgi:prolyl 4-hydroxylase
MSDVEQWRAGAERGEPIAQLRLALALVPRGEIAEALRWVEAARSKQAPEAYLVLAVLSVLGIGLQRDVARAYAYLKQAAELRSARAQAQLEALSAVDPAFWTSAPASVQHFDAPRIYTLRAFMPKQACAWLIELARPRLQRSTVYGAEARGAAEVGGRTSSQAAFNLLEPDVVLALVNLRMASLMSAPLTNFEYTTVLHYAVGQEYGLHFDIKLGEQANAFADELQQFGQRVGTMLIYLNDGYEGGETEFPRLNWRHKGAAGDALMFWSLSPHGAPELESCHAGLSVTRGEKWLLSKWLREKPFPWG